MTIIAWNRLYAEVECADRPECWPEVSSMRSGLLLLQQQNSAEKFLANKHEALVKLVASSSTEENRVDVRLLDALKTQRAAWLKYSKEECELVGSHRFWWYVALHLYR